MGSILALLSSVCYGSADFLSGYSTRRVSIGHVMLFNQVPALAITALLAIATHGQMAGATDWWWSAAAGVSIAISLPALYMALGIGPMAVVAPVTALIGIVLPVLFGVLVAHERPSLQAYIGFLLGALAVVIVSGAEHGDSTAEDKTRLTKGLLLAVVAGSGIAATYICLKQVSLQAGFWSLAVARSVSLSLLIIAALFSYRVTLEARPDFRGAIFIALAGCLDASGTMLYKSALIYGQQLSIVATLVSLYPLTTVVLATTILREQLTWQRVLGVLLALSGIGLLVS
ncbi:DMT family transporter [Burkholderia sp. Bp9012]|uniref:DMT family transporter n=1 Tax=Burkholderia sp. Bp9012 TaxID=2184562 RepID=UPI000F599E1B|nr:DMT family transporter [Burkholderia sp. Bp9012]RQR85275.1 DMT family transporter [Burkholderia sp. Bp9012]